MKEPLKKQKGWTQEHGTGKNLSKEMRTLPRQA